MINNPIEAFPGHYIFNYKNQGPSKALAGKVGIHIFFVDDAKSSWDKHALEDFELARLKARLNLETKAIIFGKTLNIEYTIHSFCCNQDIDHTNGRALLQNILDKYSFKSVADFQKYHEKRYNLNDSCILIALNKPLRSFATSASSYHPHTSEFCVIGHSGYPLHTTIMHEILHQFGAKDFYYPDAVQKSADRYIKKSIMLNPKYETVDSLTAILVGWIDFVDDSAGKFLEATSMLTQEYIYKELAKEWQKPFE